MKNANLDLFVKGDFQPINTDFMRNGQQVLSGLSTFQEEYNKFDMDSLLNEIHDSIVGHYLGFTLININKHGFDCKYSSDNPIFLESKVASFSSKTWNATFNDTTYEKAEAFKDEKVWLSLSVWNSASEVSFICFGQDKRIGEFLEEKVRHFKNGNVVRSTQSISLSTLIFKYDFLLISIDSSPRELYNKIILQNRAFKDLDWENKIIDFKDYEIPFL